MSCRHASYDQADVLQVHVLHNGRWCFGTLHEWRQDTPGGPWYGWVRFHVAPGENRIGTFGQDQLRPCPGDAGADTPA